MKFGPLPNRTDQLIGRAGPADLDRWAKRIFRAETLDAVLGKR